MLIEEALKEWSRKHVNKCCCQGAKFIQVDVPIHNPLFGKAIPCCCWMQILDARKETQNEIER